MALKEDSPYEEPTADPVKACPSFVGNPPLLTVTLYRYGTALKSMAGNTMSVISYQVYLGVLLLLRSLCPRD